jgi:hypothetical protein
LSCLPSPRLPEFPHLTASVLPSSRRLQAAGCTVGQRYLELVSLRERPGKRETTVVGILQFLSGTVWMGLFGKTADALEKSTDTANACECGSARQGAEGPGRKGEERCRTLPLFSPSSPLPLPPSLTPPVPTQSPSPPLTQS